jgi:hypothetical protein
LKTTDVPGRHRCREFLILFCAVARKVVRCLGAVFKYRFSERLALTGTECSSKQLLCCLGALNFVGSDDILQNSYGR